MSPLADEPDALVDLKRYLESLSPGPVTSKSVLERKLSAAWGCFAGSSAESMRADKLPGRVEQPEWDPPYLTFTIERHGATVNGSSRADLHRWTIDLDANTANIYEIGRRQLKKAAKRLDVKPLASEIAELILSRSADDRLKWLSDDRVQVQIGRVIPDDSYSQTVQGRRKRFRNELTRLLGPRGWAADRRTHNTYVISDDSRNA